MYGQPSSYMMTQLQKELGSYPEDDVVQFCI
jgi:hypothetical protein